jgi:hypothetical protein
MRAVVDKKNKVELKGKKRYEKYMQMKHLKEKQVKLGRRCGEPRMSQRRRKLTDTELPTHHIEVGARSA